jgi:hypothetical protein
MKENSVNLFENKVKFFKNSFNFITNRNWGKENYKHVVLCSGIPEDGGQLTDKENLDLLIGSEIAFGQIFYDGYLIGNNKAAKLRETTKKAILTSANNPMLIAYSAGILNLRNMTNEEIEKVSEVVLINPFLGDKVIADKYRIMGNIFPKTDKVMDELKPVLEKLVKLNKLKVITSDNDNFLKSKTMIDLLKDIVPSELFTERNGDHGITQVELINLINNDN